MSVDLSKIRPGDEVLIRMCVSGVRDGMVEGRFDPATLDTTTYCFKAHHVASHTPRVLAVGDPVTMRGWAGTALRILCIHNEWAWLADREDSTLQGPLASLERIP